MFAALASGLHQPCALQRLLHPGVTQVNVVLAAQLLVKVKHVKVEVLFLVQPQHRLTVSSGTRFGEGMPRRRSNNPS